MLGGCGHAFGRLSSDFGFDGAHGSDAVDGVPGDRIAVLAVREVDELAPDIAHAWGFADAACAVGFGESGVAVGVHPAFEAGEALSWVFGLAIGAEAIAGGRGRGSAPWPFVAGMDPQARYACLALGGAAARGLQAQGCVVGEDGVSSVRDRSASSRAFSTLVFDSWL